MFGFLYSHILTDVFLKRKIQWSTLAWLPTLHRLSGLQGLKLDVGLWGVGRFVRGLGLAEGLVDYKPKTLQPKPTPSCPIPRTHQSRTRKEPPLKTKH